MDHQRTKKDLAFLSKNFNYLCQMIFLSNSVEIGPVDKVESLQTDSKNTNNTIFH